MNKQLFNLGSNPQERVWRVKMSDGEHEIKLQPTRNSSETTDLYVDGKPIKTLENARKNLFKPFKCDFECGGEVLSLVMYARDADVVRDGIFVSSGLPYKPEDILPKWLQIVSLIFNCASFLMYFPVKSFYAPESDGSLLFFVAWMFVSFYTSLLIISRANSPFLKKWKKYAEVTSIPVACWAMIASIFVVIFTYVVGN